MYNKGKKNIEPFIPQIVGFLQKTNNSADGKLIFFLFFQKNRFDI